MKAKHQKVICTSFYCNSRLLGLNLTGGCHPLPEIDGWPANRATRSNKGPDIPIFTSLKALIILCFEPDRKDKNPTQTSENGYFTS